MTFISENIIPGNYGKKFTTDVDEPSEKTKLEAGLMEVDGVKEVVFEDDVYPLEFTVYTNHVVNITDLQDKAQELGFHMFAKGPFFPLFG